MSEAVVRVSPKAARAVQKAAEIVRSQVPAASRECFVPTLGTAVTVDELLELMCDALRSGDCRELQAWVERRAQRTANVTAFRDLLTLAVETTVEYASIVVALEPEDEAAVKHVAATIRQAAVRAQARTAVTRHAPLDEVTRLIEDLVVRLDGADRVTAEHSRAVSAWSARIASRLGLGQREVARIARGGLIHDIGKVTTPPSILLAPRKLDDEERAVMERHVIAGVQILSGYPLLDPLQSIVRSHHERIDGRGYPDEMPGAEIPLEVRIVSVADSFNAMIGRRPYRRPFGAERALEELERHRNAQFDAEVVAALIDLVSRDKQRRIL
jgi:putative nucleotidyltransferase with HDIG domain